MKRRHSVFTAYGKHSFQALSTCVPSVRALLGFPGDIREDEDSEGLIESRYVELGFGCYGPGAGFGCYCRWLWRKMREAYFMLGRLIISLLKVAREQANT